MRVKKDLKMKGGIPLYWRGCRLWPFRAIYRLLIFLPYLLDTIQDFLCKLGMIPHMQAIGNHHFFTKACHRQTYQNY